MKKFKKLYLALITVLCLSLSLLFVACKPEEEDPKVYISFEPQNGTTIERMLIDDDFSMPANPTKEDHVFAGWYLDLNYANKFDETKASTYTESFTVYAKWVADDITLSALTLSTSGNLVSWTPVTTNIDGLEVVYLVTVNDELILTFADTSISLDMYGAGTHTVEVQGVLKTNSDYTTEAKTIDVAWTAPVDNTSNVVNSANASVAKDGNQDVLVLYKGITANLTKVGTKKVTDVKCGTPFVKINDNIVSGAKDGKKVIPSKIGGPFKMTVVLEDGSSVEYKTYVYPQVSDFRLEHGATADAKQEYLQQNNPYKVGVGNEFKLNTEVIDIEANAFRNNPAVVKVFDGDQDITSTVIDESTGTYVNFNDEKAGSTYTLKVSPKFYPSANATSLEKSITITLTAGINVYTNEELKAAVEDIKVGEISIHNNIVAAFDADQYVGDTDVIAHIGSQHLDKDNYKGSGNVYTRFVDKTDADAVKSLKINGNYYDIDGRNLKHAEQVAGVNDDPTKEGVLDDTTGGYLHMREAFDYDIVNMYTAIFAFAANTPGFEVNISDLHIVGNCDLTNETLDSQMTKEFVRQESGSLHGIATTGAKLNTNNVFIQNVMQGYQLQSENTDVEYYINNNMVNEASLNYTKVKNTFYGSVFVSSSKVEIKNSHLSNAGCALVVVHDNYDNATQSGYPYDPEVTLYSSNVYENWVSGSEPYYATEEEFNPTMINTLKQQVSQNLAAQATGHSIIKKIGSAEKFNFILQFNESDFNKQAQFHFIDDVNATPYADVNIYREYLYAMKHSVIGEYQNPYGAGADLRAQVGMFMSPVGMYSTYAKLNDTQDGLAEDCFAYIATKNPATAFPSSFNNGLATFRNELNSEKAERKILELNATIDLEAPYDDITVFIEIGAPGENSPWMDAAKIANPGA